MSAIANRTLERAGSTSPSAARLSAVEAEVIGLFVQLARILDLPKSIAELYGLLFASPKPLSMDELIARLSLSKGSASQGLRFLRNLGAVRSVYVPGSRRDYYVAETELRQLVAGFLKERLAPHLEESLERLDRIKILLRDMPAEDRSALALRLEKLQQWEKRGKQFIPLLSRLLS